MKLYYVSGDGDTPYYVLKTDACAAARTIARDSYHDVPVHRVDVETNKETILRMLNMEGGYHQDLGVVYTAKAKRK